MLFVIIRYIICIINCIVLLLLTARIVRNEEADGPWSRMAECRQLATLTVQDARPRPHAVRLSPFF